MKFLQIMYQNLAKMVTLPEEVLHRSDIRPYGWQTNKVQISPERQEMPSFPKSPF